LAERFVTNGVVSEPLWGQLKALTADPAVRVRYQVAFTLGELRHVGRTVALTGVLARNLTNGWVQTAVVSALSEGAGEFFLLLASDNGFRRDEVGQEFLRQLALMIGTKGRLDEVSQVLDYIGRAPLEPAQVFGWLFAAGDGLQRTRSSLGLVDPQGRLQPLYLRALDAAMNEATPEAARVAAIQLLGLSPFTFSDTGDWLPLMCNAGASARLQAAAIGTLSRYSDPRVVPELLARWSGLTPTLRQQALAGLLQRSERVPEVLAAVERGRISPADFGPAQLNLLRTYPDPAISARAVHLFGAVPRQRPEAVQRWKPALRLKGMTERGREVFLNRCAECHRFGGEGQALGPDLTGARIHGKEKLLAAILEPKAGMSPQYAACLLQTKEGESLLGIPSEANAAAITLRQPKGVQIVWPRLNVQFLQPQPWSLMPENLEQGLAPQDMADLLDYLMTGPR
ncbi:MAG TPA: c-type cytochrome, partial [Candidatus Sulfotelmatobacter sp.]|nr:c-type cytochrome [Candidatus Sulfotelmatobacter sp.]